jgi:hypothetical protein
MIDDNSGRTENPTKRVRSVVQTLTVTDAEVAHERHVRLDAKTEY